MPTNDMVPLYEMPARVVEHVNEFAVGMLVTVYVPSRSKILYVVPDKVTAVPTDM
jgi:hypothetical protein